MVRKGERKERLRAALRRLILWALEQRLPEAMRPEQPVVSLYNEWLEGAPDLAAQQEAGEAPFTGRNV